MSLFELIMKHMKKVEDKGTGKGWNPLADYFRSKYMYDIPKLKKGG